MVVTFGEKNYICSKAVRKDAAVTLYLEDGGMIRFGGVRDASAFVLEGGAWSLPEVTPEEQLRADVDFIAIMTGVSL